MMKNSMKKMIVLALVFTMALGVFQVASTSIATAATTREDLVTFKKGLDWLSANRGRSYLIRSDGNNQNANTTVKNAVKALQRLLRAMGYGVAVDGIFGNETYNAVKKAQKTLGITSDGLPGMATYEALEKFFTATSHGYRILYPAEGAYTISYAGNENYGLAVEGGSTNTQARILLDYAGTKFILKHVGNGWYKIFFASNPNLLVNVMNGYNGLDGRLWSYHDDNTAAGIFRFLDAGNGHVIIESKLGTVIDLDNGNAFAGALVHMWSLPCYNEWVLKTVETVSPIQKSINYAKDHWDDGKGLCAEFVSDYLARAGINVPNKSSYYTSNTKNLTGGKLGAYTNPYTCAPALLKWFEEQGYTIIKNPSPSDINLGDVGFFCGRAGHSYDSHVVIVTGKDSSGYTYSAHNAAKKKANFSFTGTHKLKWLVKLNYSDNGLTPIQNLK